MILDEEATHAWLYIDDFVKALLAGETELGGDLVITNKEIVLMLEKISGKRLKYTTGKLRSYDNSNWRKGNVDSDVYEGLKQTYEYFTRKDN